MYSVTQARTHATHKCTRAGVNREREREREQREVVRATVASEEDKN